MNLTDDVLWSAQNPRLRRLPSRSHTVVGKRRYGRIGQEKTFSSTQMGGANRTLWQMSRSEDNDVWPFTKALSTSPGVNTSNVGYLVWRRSRVCAGAAARWTSQRLLVFATQIDGWGNLERCKPQIQPCRRAIIAASARFLASNLCSSSLT